jgi:hypothetical protein
MLVMKQKSCGRIRQILQVTLLIAVVALVAKPLTHRIARYGVDSHMRSVTKSLSDWANEYSDIKTDSDAGRAVEMLGYIKTYYIPGEGYRGSPQIELILENQRAKALEKHSGERFGTNIRQWSLWVASKQSKQSEKKTE